MDELRARDVGLRVLAGAGAEIGTTSANGRLFFGILAALAEFDRELRPSTPAPAWPRRAPGGRFGG